MQVSEKEREVLLEKIRKELITIVSSKIVHPETNRLFPANMVEDAIAELGFDVKISDSAKKQANFLIKELSKRYLIKKADMEIKVTIKEEWVITGEDTGEELVAKEAPKKKHSIDEQHEGQEEEEEEVGTDDEKPMKKPHQDDEDNPKHSKKHKHDDIDRSEDSDHEKKGHKKRSHEVPTKKELKDTFKEAKAEAGTPGQARKQVAGAKGSVKSEEPQLKKAGPAEETKNLKEKHEAFKEYLKSNSISMREVKEGKLLVYLCVIDAGKYKEISVITKNYYPKSISEITEYMLVNKTVGEDSCRNPRSVKQNTPVWA